MFCTKRRLLTAVVLPILTTVAVFAKDPGTSAALILTEAPGARLAAVGEAGAAASNDITAFAYNPATLRTLQMAQGSLLYEKGIADDTFGRFLFGFPVQAGAFGFSVGHYDAGEVDILVLGERETFNAQKDWTGSFGYAFGSPKLAGGLAVKYVNSKLVEEFSGKAWAADAGLIIEIHPRITAGIAAQNIGTKLKYMEVEQDLPRLARAGAALKLIEGRVPVTVFLDAPYLMTEKYFAPAGGMEVGIGPLFLRGGYKSGSDLEGLSAGAGFRLGRVSLDYVMGFVEELDARHRVSLALQFGPSGASNPLTEPTRRSGIQAVEQDRSSTTIRPQVEKAMPVTRSEPKQNEDYVEEEEIILEELPRPVRPRRKLGDLTR